MIHKIFTIYDEKARAYLTPFFLPESGMAVRTFADCVNSESHQFGKHPSDYTLFTLGVWDDSDATLNFHDRSLSLGNGVEFIQRQPQENPDNAGNLQKAIFENIGDDPPVLTSPEGGNSEV